MVIVEHNNTSIIKAAFIVAMGSFATLTIFVAMSKLAQVDMQYSEPTVYFTPEIGTVRDEEPETEIVKALPEPPKHQPQPKNQPEPVSDTLIDDVGLQNNFEVAMPKPSLNSVGMSAPSNTQARPIIQVEPKYPMAAAREGIEGWVKLSFSIDATGRTDNITVIESEPRRVFDNAARSALKRWKYQAKMVDGKAVSQPNQLVMLEFGLNK